MIANVALTYCKSGRKQTIAQYVETVTTARDAAIGYGNINTPVHIDGNPGTPGPGTSLTNDAMVEAGLLL